MRIAVIGAGGSTGERVVAQALQRGYEAVAVARRPLDAFVGVAGVKNVIADALDADAIGAAVDGCDGVVSALGAGSRAETNLYSEGAANLVAGMSTHGIRRIAVVSAAPVGDRSVHPPLQRRIVVPLLYRVFGAAYRDMERMEATLAESDLDWVSLRPPRLIARKGRGEYRMRADAPPKGGRSLRYDDLATALLDVVSDETPTKRAVYLAN